MIEIGWSIDETVFEHSNLIGKKSPKWVIAELANLPHLCFDLREKPIFSPFLFVSLWLLLRFAALRGSSRLFAALRGSSRLFALLSFFLIYNKIIAQNTTPQCDCLTSGFEIINSSAISDPSGLIQWFGKKINITQNLTINSDIEISNTCVKVAPGVKIIIGNGRKFTVSNQSKFFGCNNLWKGIEAGEGVVVDLSGSTFRDAVFSIQLLPGYKVFETKITGCTFTNNRIGIHVGQTNSGHSFQSILFLPKEFHDNTFTCQPTSGNQAAVLPFVNETQLQIAKAGIYFYKCILGAVSGSNNTWENMHFGLYSVDSNVGVVDQTFKNLRSDFTSGPFNDPSAGCGISALGGGLIIQNCVFENSANGGVKCWSSNVLSITSCQFRTLGNWGIYASGTSPLGNVFKIFKNTFTDSQLGNYFKQYMIYVERAAKLFDNGSWNCNQISDNTLSIKTFRTTPFTAIYIDAIAGGDAPTIIGKSSSDTYGGLANSVNFSDACFQANAIFITGKKSLVTNGIEVSNNIVAYTALYTGVLLAQNLGISFIGLNGNNTVFGNQVSSTLKSTCSSPEKCSQLKCGIHIDSSPKAKICGNTTENTGRGFHFAGDNGFSHFGENIIKKAYNGVVCAKSNASDPNTNLATLSVPDLKWHKNVWLTGENPYLHKGAIYEDNNNNNPFKFFVDAAIAGHRPTQQTPSGSTWFVSQDQGNTQSTYQCSGTNLQPPGDDPDKSIIHSDTSVFVGVYATTSSPAFQWDSRRNLNRKLTAFPNLRPNGSLAAQYYTQQVSSSALKFAEVELQLSSVYDYPNNWQNSLTALVSQQSFWSDSLFRLSQIQNPSNAQKILCQQATGQLAIVQTQFDSVSSQIDSFVKANISVAKSAILNLPTTNIWESNLKTILIADAKHKNGEQLDSVEEVALRQIIAQCYEQGGESIRLAANWLPNQERMAWLSNEEPVICPPSLQAGVADRNKPVTLLLQESLTIAPNPTDGIIHVWFPKQPETQGTWKILDMLGRTMLSGSLDLDAAFLSISTSNLASGIYRFQYEHKGDRTLARSFIVSH